MKQSAKQLIEAKHELEDSIYWLEDALCHLNQQQEDLRQRKIAIKNMLEEDKFALKKLTALHFQNEKA